jgi:imidazolonepropionase-like amidohydrolase
VSEGHAPRIYLTADRAIDGTSDEVLWNVALTVEGERITALGPAATVPMPSGARLIALGSRTLLPGLIDLHTHLTKRNVGRTFADPPHPWCEEPGSEAAYDALRAVGRLQEALTRGVTTLRDVGSWGDAVIAARWAVRRGAFAGARAYVSRRALTIRGGHGSVAWGESGGREVSGADDAREAVREQIAAGADLMKIVGDGAGIPYFTQAEMDAIVDETHNAGRPVACHANVLETVRKALRAGVDSIEHGTDLDEDVVATMAERGVVLVPTFLILKASSDAYPEGKRPVFVERAAMRPRSFELALRAGVTIGTGTDAAPPLCNFADIPEEIGLMVQRGCPPMRAIRGATGVAGALLRAENDVGTLAPGRYADVIAVDGDPSTDISALKRLAFVMHGGHVHQAPPVA